MGSESWCEAAKAKERYPRLVLLHSNLPLKSAYMTQLSGAFLLGNQSWQIFKNLLFQDGWDEDFFLKPQLCSFKKSAVLINKTTARKRNQRFAIAESELQASRLPWSWHIFLISVPMSTFLAFRLPKVTSFQQLASNALFGLLGLETAPTPCTQGEE